MGLPSIALQPVTAGAVFTNQPFIGIEVPSGTGDYLFFNAAAKGVISIVGNPAVGQAGAA